MPVETLIFYAAIGLWAVLLFHGLRTSNFKGFVALGIGIMLVLNIGYFVRGQGDSIAYFVSLYDLLDNLGVSSSSGDLPAALATCPDNACSIADNYDSHPAWGVAFYERFVNGPTGRRNLLFGHIAMNTVAFVLAHIQLARPGTGEHRQRHRLLGRAGFGALTLGTLFAVLLASEHSSVSEYGGVLSMLGFYSMAFVVYGCAVKTVTTARSGDIASHRIWMFRFIGSMWGAFWLFRVMLFVLGPLLRNVEGGAFLICVWASAPLGVAIAEWFRLRRPSIDVRASAESTPATQSASPISAT